MTKGDLHMLKRRISFVLSMTIRALLFGSAFLFVACAASKDAVLVSQHSENSAGVIGGKPVEPHTVLSEKVMYLAVGVQHFINPQGQPDVSWESHCTASALTRRILLTAAHCVIGKSANQINLVLTANPETTAKNLNDWISVQQIRIHEGYFVNETSTLNDLALLSLSQDLPDSRILKIAQPEQLRSPLSIVTVGYGTSSALINQNGPHRENSTLNYVMKAVSEFQFQSKTFSINQRNHRGFCSGDSGGPGLIYDLSSKEFYILGIVSHSHMTPTEKNSIDPEGKYSLCIGEGHYTNLLETHLNNWISQNLQQLSN